MLRDEESIWYFVFSYFFVCQLRHRFIHKYYLSWILQVTHQNKLMRTFFYSSKFQYHSKFGCLIEKR